MLEYNAKSSAAGARFESAKGEFLLVLQPSAYGFEGMTPEFPNLLKLHQHIKIIKLKISIFLLIFHVLADFGKVSSHKFSLNYNGLPCV